MGLTERATQLLHLGGAALSVALVIGVGVWGFKLLVRDVTGLPVVRAIEGPMRISPDRPGGEVALNTGLSVNAIAAVGEAAPPEDTLRIAPQTQGLAPEDLEVALSPEDEAVLSQEAPPEATLTPAAVIAPVAATDGPMTEAQILALADQIAAGVPPLTDVAAPATVAVIAADVPGLARTLRPLSRPANRAAPAPQATPVAASAATVSGPLAAGTPFVQLGAYPELQDAATDWDRLLARFPEFLVAQERVIQQAESGGDVFYRLRAIGFDDLAAARRLCVAISADGTPCVPSLVP